MSAHELIYITKIVKKNFEEQAKAMQEQQSPQQGMPMPPQIPKVPKFS